MIAESVAFLVGAGQARRLRRRALLRRLARRRGLRAALPARGRRGRRRDRRAAATPTAARCRGQIADGDARRRGRGSAERRAVGIHCHNDAGCGVANTLAGVRGGRHARAGHDQRLRRALRQREPRLDHPQPAAQARATSASTAERLARLTETAHFVDELLTSRPTPTSPTSGKQRVRPQGRHARRRRATRTRRRSSTSTRTVVGNRRELLVSELSGKGTVRARPSGRARPRRRGRRTRVVERVKELEHARLPLRGRRRLVRAAAAQGDRATTSRCSGSSPGA